LLITSEKEALLSPLACRGISIAKKEATKRSQIEKAEI
jgi:hypothetical protein